ncbi:12277_t:CDS:2 [Gigaspora margarita]|uniref:12277_t:CDS:1 n=1 Tax=Gigaspora margarita TaxID=4874 RepID=A0ABN7UJH9_GIGMA|nr:12277_t:CDS:2 [Gigaspora margarita]
MSEFEEMIVEMDQTKPHNGITKLLPSPNGEYAVTWSRDDKSICGWQINNNPIRHTVEQSSKELGEQSENKLYQFEFKCLIKVGDRCPLTVSNNKYVVMGTIGQTGQNVADCYLSDEGKIMLLDKCGSLTQWNLNTLLFEKQYQLDANRPTKNTWHCIFSKNSTLLAVNRNEFIYTYLTDNSMFLSQFNKIQNNNWDDSIEKPYLSNSLLNIISKDKVSDKDNLLQKELKIFLLQEKA